MPLMAAYEQDDARGAAWLLATTAKECLYDRKKSQAYVAALVNTFRMLEAYRSGDLFGLDRLPLADNHEPSEPLAANERIEQHALDVRIALDESIKDVFAGSTTELAIDMVESVLRAVAYPKDFGNTIDEEAKNKADKFLEKFIMKLQGA